MNRMGGGMFGNLPLNALRAFEAMARRGTAVHAAAELMVTPGAVTRQVRQLEGLLGHPLFTRSNLGMRLTPDGQALAQRLTGLFRDLSQSLRPGPPGGRRHLRIGVPRAFAAYVLVPALHGFLERHPDVDVELDGDAQAETPGPRGCDLVIRYGQPELTPGLLVHPLPAATIFPIAAPSLGDMGDDPSGWVGQIFLHFASYDYWDAWLDRRPRPKAVHDLWFSETSMLYAAAEAGLGLAIGHSQVAHPLLASGRLRRIGCAIPDLQRYTIVRSDADGDDPVAKDFQEWLDAHLAGLEKGGGQPLPQRSLRA